MPLVQGKGKKALGTNIKKLRDEGYPEKQAIAISFSEQGENNNKSTSKKPKSDKK